VDGNAVTSRFLPIKPMRGKTRTLELQRAHGAARAGALISDLTKYRRPAWKRRTKKRIHSCSHPSGFELDYLSLRCYAPQHYLATSPGRMPLRRP
jgi:hypothetical protein